MYVSENSYVTASFGPLAESKHVTKPYTPPHTNPLEFQSPRGLSQGLCHCTLPGAPLMGPHPLFAPLISFTTLASTLIINFCCTNIKIIPTELISIGNYRGRPLIAFLGWMLHRQLFRQMKGFQDLNAKQRRAEEQGRAKPGGIHILRHTGMCRILGQFF